MTKPEITKEMLVCKCCGKEATNQILSYINAINIMCRTDLSKLITSGRRCEKHNEEIGGAPHSLHLSGMAVDIHCKLQIDRFDILSAIFRHNELFEGRNGSGSRIFLEIGDAHLHIGILGDNEQSAAAWCRSK